MTDYSIVHAGWLIDGTGSLAAKDVLIHSEDNLICKIEPVNQHYLRNIVEKSWSFLDLSAYTVLPRLVDCHVHLFMSGTGDMDVRKRQLDAGYDDLEDMIVQHIGQHINCGVGAIRDGGDSKGHALRLKNEKTSFWPINESDFIIKAAGKAWHRKGRYGKLIARSPSQDESLAEAIRKDALQPGYIRPDHIKIVNSGVNSLLCFGNETLPQFSLSEMTSAIQEANRQKLPVMVHANGKLPVQIAVEAGCNSIEHGFFMGYDNLAKMRDRQITWVPTAITMKAYAKHLPPSGREAQTAQKNLDHQLDQLRKARDMGVQIAVGTDSGSLGVHHGHAVREEIRILLDAGFSIHEAIHCATSAGTRLLGIDGYMGKITPGMPLKYIVVKGSPFDLPDSLGNVFLQHESIEFTAQVRFLAGTWQREQYASEPEIEHENK